MERLADLLVSSSMQLSAQQAGDMLQKAGEALQWVQATTRDTLDRHVLKKSGCYVGCQAKCLHFTAGANRDGADNIGGYYQDAAEPLIGAER